MVDIIKHFVRGGNNDDKYSTGPNVNSKCYNKNQTLKLTVTEFITPTLFFACEFTDSEYELDEKLNLMYSTFEKYFKFDDVPKVGTVIVANYHEDRRWYRGRILRRSVKDLEVDVYFIDFGNIEKSVPLRRIRKLESTFSSQFCTFMKSDSLKSQAVLFGYVGAAPVSERQLLTKKSRKLEALLLKHPFQFQVIEIPDISTHIRNEFHVRVPLYLLKSDPFNEAVQLNYQNWLEENLRWREGTLEESFGLIKDELIILNPEELNVQIVMPPSLKSLQNGRKRFDESYSDDSNEASSKLKVQNNGKNEARRIEIEESFESDTEIRKLIRFKVHSTSTREDGNELGHNNVSDHGSVNDLSDGELINDKSFNNVEDNDQIIVSIKDWKITKKMVKSLISNLDWHFPLPDEETFPAIVSTEMKNDLYFYINICYNGIGVTYDNMEKILMKHYLLCHDSMLKQYIHNDFNPTMGTLCLCAHDSTFYRCVVQEILDDKQAHVMFIDLGETIDVLLSDLIPISSQFCQIPQLALKCELSGIDKCQLLSQSDKMSLIKEINQILEENKYEILVTLKLNNETKDKDNSTSLVIDQPLSVEVFVKQGDVEAKEYDSLNLYIHNWLDNVEELGVINEEIDETIVEDAAAIVISSESDDIEEGEIVSEESDEEEEDDAAGGIGESCDDGVDDIVKESELKDIYLRENIYQQSELGNKKSQRAVCEYYRRKGRCFKGKKCEDRHVMHSDDDDEDNDNNVEDNNAVDDAHNNSESNISTKQLKIISSLLTTNSDNDDIDNDLFKRCIEVGTVLGVRVTCIYNNGIFYGYLTHGIRGFDMNSSFNDCNDDDDNNDENNKKINEYGMNYGSIYDMENDLGEFLKFEPNPIEKTLELIKGSMVAVRRDDRVHRATIKQKLSGHHYEVFLVDYGIVCQVNKKSIFYLPTKFYKRFRQQCFMFKLNDVSFADPSTGTDDTEAVNDNNVDNDTNYNEFADWFYGNVNNKVLHAKIIDCYEDSLYVVDLYDFVTCGVAAESLNKQAKVLFGNESQK